MISRFINTHNIAVWLRYTMLPHQVATETLLAFAKHVPDNIGWRMLLVSAQQYHCAWQDVGLSYIKACLWTLGLADAYWQLLGACLLHLGSQRNTMT